MKKQMEEQEVKFGFSAPKQGGPSNGRIEQVAVSAIVMTISNEDGDKVYEQKELSLYEFDGTYLSQPVSLLPGNYQVTDFVVLDEEGEVVYLSPKEGSPKAYLVSDPLSIAFDVVSEQVSTVVPEVLSTEESVPEDFGYASFSFEEIETFDFLVKIFKYDSLNKVLKPTAANLVVSSEETTLYSGSLDENTNKITVVDNYPEYTVTIQKPGFQTYQHTFTNAELKAYFKSTENGPLEVVLNSLPASLILWNKLGSEEEILNSEVGPSFAFDGTPTYLASQHGNGFKATMTEQLLFADHTQVLPDAGKFTMEFWITYDSYGIVNGNADNGTEPHIITAYGGVGFFHQRSRAVAIGGASGEAGQINLFIPSVNIPQGSTVHWAIVYDKNGIDGSANTARLYLNGSVVASSDSKSVGDLVFPSPGLMVGGRLHGVTANWNADCIIDNIKIFDEAKTDFSDRFVE